MVMVVTLLAIVKGNINIGSAGSYNNQQFSDNHVKDYIAFNHFKINLKK